MTGMADGAWPPLNASRLQTTTVCRKETRRLEGKDQGGEGLVHLPWLSCCVTHAGSSPWEAGWGLVLSKRTGLCRFPSNPCRQQAASETRPSREKLKRPWAQMQNGSQTSSQMGMVGPKALPASPKTKLHQKAFWGTSHRGGLASFSPGLQPLQHTDSHTCQLTPSLPPGNRNSRLRFHISGA